MALDVASLTLDDSQASLASMPEELWRKITSINGRRTIDSSAFKLWPVVIRKKSWKESRNLRAA